MKQLTNISPIDTTNYYMISLYQELGGSLLRTDLIVHVQILL